MKTASNVMTIDRRVFLKVASVAAGAALLRARQAVAAEVPGQSAAATAFREKLVGPILSVPTPFTKTFDVDHACVRKMIGIGRDAGIGVFALTSGDGQYNWLRYEEIKALTKTVAEAFGGKGVMISAAGGWSTQQCVEYAKFAEGVGASAVQLLLPEISDEDAIVGHFEAVAAATKLPIVMHGNYGASLLEKLVKIESVAALKEDVTLDYYIDRERKFGKRLSIFGGGTEYRFLIGHPYGSPAYYSAYAAFAPAESMKFWRMIQNGDTTAAYAWAQKFDHPFLDRWSHAFWRGSVEYFGVGQRYLRPPVRSLTDEQMKDVKAFFDECGLKPA